MLANCDAFEQFPPRFFVPLFIAARSARLGPRPAGPAAGRAPLSPLAFGPLLNPTHRRRSDPRWIQPMLDSSAIRHDITRAASPAGMQRTERRRRPLAGRLHRSGAARVANA